MLIIHFKLLLGQTCASKSVTFAYKIGALAFNKLSLLLCRQIVFGYFNAYLAVIGKLLSCFLVHGSSTQFHRGHYLVLVMVGTVYTLCILGTVFIVDTVRNVGTVSTVRTVSWY